MRTVDRLLRLARWPGLIAPPLTVALVLLSFAVAALQLGRLPRALFDDPGALPGPAGAVARLCAFAVFYGVLAYALSVPLLLARALLVARAERARAALELAAALLGGAAVFAFVRANPLYMVAWFMD